jgi:uncharacterized membrane protein
MTGKLRLLFWLGIIMLFLPFFGIPNTWKTILAVIIGIVLIGIALQLRKQYRAMRIIIRSLEQNVAATTLHNSPEEIPHA